jgi:curved DNA-binding protein CbpA
VGTEDYYDLIGVSPDADRDTIRDAYRARRAELSDDEAGRARAARLNRAWNVLSDTTQRERYDDQLAAAKADGDVVVPDGIESPNGSRGAASGRPLTRSQQRRQRYAQQQANRPARQPVAMVTEINGVPLASVRDRMFALVIDGFIAFLLLYVVGLVVVRPAYEKNQKPDVVHAIDVENKQLDRIQKDIDNDIKQRDAAQSKKDTAAVNHWQRQKATDEKRYDDKVKQINHEQGKLTGIDFQVFGASAVVTLLIFAVPTALTGKSPGKALRNIKLVKDDATTPVGWGTAFLHYGVVLGFIVASFGLGGLAQIAWIVAVFGVSSFTRNPKRQGWDNRISKTVVVQA